MTAGFMLDDWKTGGHRPPLQRTMKLKTWLSTVLLLCCAASLHAQNRETLLKYLHDSPEWTSSGNAKPYDENNIQSLTGKSASTLKRYGMIGVTVQEWKNGPTP